MRVGALLRSLMLVLVMVLFVAARSGGVHGRTRLSAALRYAFGTVLIVAVWVGGAQPALAGIVPPVDCDGWSVTLDDYDAGSKAVSIWIDYEVVVHEFPFENGFSLGGPGPVEYFV